MLIFISLLVFWSISTICYADADVDALWTEANICYKQGDYEKAAAQYETLANKIQSSQIFYNLGNAYYKQNKMGLAILNYERALKYSPKDEKALRNLNIAKAKAGDIVVSAPSQVYVFLSELFPLNVWGILSLIFFPLLLIAIFLLLYLHLSKKYFLILSVCTVCSFLIFCVSALSVVVIRENMDSKDFAIVTTEEASFRSSPESTSKSLMEIREGSKIKIVGDIEDFYEVRLPNGTNGWISKAELTII